MQTKVFTVEPTNGLKYEIDVTNAPEAMLAGVFMQGLRILFQRSTARGAENKMTEQEKRQAWAALFEELRDGKWRPGSVGTLRLDPVEKELRRLLVAKFVASGVKASEADKYSRDDDRQSYYRDLVVKPVLEKQAPERMAELATLTQKNWDKLESEAQANVAAAAKAVVVIEL